MKPRPFASAVSALALLSACSGGGGGGSPISTVNGPSPTPTPTPTPVPTPSPTPAAVCSLRDRQDWAFQTLQEWYLFSSTLPTSLDPTPYSTVDDYIDALTANARAQNKDRYFTYLTSISEEDAYYNSGSSAGFGVRFALDTSGTRLFVIESFENAPALNAGIDRGAEILAIGTTASNLQSVSGLLSSGGTNALNNALGPDTAGTTRYFQVRNAGGTRTVAVTKTDFTLDPVSSRYGAKVISDGGKLYGYVNLRTFINTAEPGLRQAFANFKAQGITSVIVDLRYNGGGLISVAELLSNLLGGNRASGDVIDYLTFRPEKASENSVTNFAAQPESIAPTRIAFIGSGGTASASELVINAFWPYLHGSSALIGTNTYGKPVGQVAIDRSECDDRFRVIAFAVENSAHQGTYYNGLAQYAEASCQAGDDISHQLGDPQEATTRQALDYLEGKSCTPIAGSGQTSQSLSSTRRILLSPARPNTQQREVPGFY